MTIQVIEFPAHLIAINAQFGGHEGAFTITPERMLDLTGMVKITISDDGKYITQIELPNGWKFKHENATGANIHGGNHTTSEWLTFDIGQFRLMDDEGNIHHNSPRLTDKEWFRGAHTITPRYPQPAICFGPDVLVNTPEQGAVRECAAAHGLFESQLSAYLARRIPGKLRGYTFRR